MNQRDQFNVKCGDQTPDFERPPKLRERRVAIGKIKHSDHKKIYNFIKNQDFCLKKGNLGEENNKEKK